MDEAPLVLFLADADETDRLADLIAPHLRAGDVVLMEGSIGAGKTHFARRLIRARLGRQEDVPSPTFTLVQTYEADPDIWHADLYRLSHPDDVRELGLEEAFDAAICLVEWPDRLGEMAPQGALRLRLRTQGEGRLAEIGFGGRGDLKARVAVWALHARTAACEAMLARAGWQAAARQALTADASARSYARLGLRGKTRILMDAPPGLADDTGAFVAIDRHLRQIGLSAPEIHGADLQQGWLLLEDLGDAVFARLMAEDPACETTLCRAAIDVLLHLQDQPAAPGLPDLAAKDWAKAALVVLDWYRFAVTGDKGDGTALEGALTGALRAWADGPRVMILRDYHAENLMWLPQRQGLARVGVLDFQLAQMGQPGYDLVSLLQDARRDVSAKTEAHMLEHFAAAKGIAPDRFASTYAALGAQRALRILGIFARLCLVDGKAQYVALIPRVWGQLQRNLAQPELVALRAVCDAVLPEPTAGALERIGAQCGHFR